ncbi:Hypothetical protein, putative [Bodo saltans]|uniref:Uncharacterized protein n=1 Tax=Bodo saltans TaxID=75058 RepID=A0A0S4JWA2_BODSA|nr:Hypothetical protein, putative [Bodo saltans]|eukprot:CUG93414.1 Hypothetical protein, putative [Bodo saltans]
MCGSLSASPEGEKAATSRAVSFRPCFGCDSLSFQQNIFIRERWVRL